MSGSGRGRGGGKGKGRGKRQETDEERVSREAIERKDQKNIN